MIFFRKKKEEKSINRVLTDIFDVSADEIFLIRLQRCETTNNLFQNVNSHMDRESSLTSLFVIFSFLASLNNLSSNLFVDVTIV